MDKKKLEELVKFMDENNLLELEIEENNKKIKLKKIPPKDFIQTSYIPPTSTPTVETTSPKQQENLIEIKSPMVGTFYRAPAPGAKPYVEVGDTVEAGDVVCIIEAMKLMNEIKAEVPGKIIEILQENGQPVEFGQPLFLLEPTS